MFDLSPGLKALDAAHRRRTLRVAAGRHGVERPVDGRPLLSFCSNDYLGLAGHPALAEALTAGVQEYGVGAGAAHLVSGHTEAHQALEQELAAFTGRPRALLFSTGYMANLGLISALLGRGDTLVQDRLNHASLADAGILSRAKVRRFAHADPQAAEAALGQAPAGRRLLATDGVFSMDGDLAPLPQLARICTQGDAWLMVDDAHGLGVLGATGRGSLEHFGLDAKAVPVLMGTLGKALGVFGAFVAGGDELIETLIHRARSYVYTTAMPPALCQAVRAALRLTAAEPWRRQRLRELTGRFRERAQALGLPLMPSQTPIQPLLAGSETRALAWSRALEQAGIQVTAIRPPTVPEGQSRLRITFSAEHTDEQLDRLLEALARLPESAGEGA